MRNRTTKLINFIEDAKAHGMEVTEHAGRVVVRRSARGPGVVIYHDKGRFTSAHRADVKLELATRMTLIECVKLLME